MSRLKKGLHLATTAMLMMTFSPIASAAVLQTSQSMSMKSSIQIPLTTVTPDQVQSTQSILSQELMRTTNGEQKIAGWMDFDCGDWWSMSGLELGHCLIYGKLK
jgi:hypothetical protein